MYGEADVITKLQIHWMDKRSTSGFHASEVWVDKNGQQSNLVFANPSLFHLLRYSDLRLHLDATFKCCPKSHNQCLIMSNHDMGTNMHIPIFYVLMTTKTEEAYERAINQIKYASGMMFITVRCSSRCDFTHH